MTTVKRYIQWCGVTHGHGMMEDAKGQWVPFVDHEKALADARRAALLERGTCNWEQEDDEDSDCWLTDCGHTFRLDEGAPSENHMKFCCYCGKCVTETRQRASEGV